MTALVVGAGIAGLTAALELGRAGVPTILVEASDRVGGKIATDRTDGFVIELGPDSMLTTRPAAIELARELGLADDLIGVSEPRAVHILRGGKPVPMPEGVGLVLPTKARPFVTTALFSWREKMQMAMDLVMPRVLPAEDVSVGRFLRRRLGPALVSRLAGPLVGGIYGTSIDEVSLDAVVPTLRTAERDHRSLILAGLSDGRKIRGRMKAAAAGSKSLGVFASLRGGLGELIGALESELDRLASVRLEYGVTIRSIEGRGTGYRVRATGGRAFDVDAVVIATPGPAAAAALSSVATAASDAIASIPHGSTSVVSFAYGVEQFREPPHGHGWLIPANERMPISALTFSSNKWAGRSPDGAVLLRAFLPDQPDRGQGPNELVELARAAVERLTGVRGDPRIVRASTFQRTMPRYTVGHVARVERAVEELAHHPRLALAGAPYHGVGLPDCISGAQAAARKLLEEIGAEVQGSDRAVA